MAHRRQNCLLLVRQDELDFLENRKYQNVLLKDLNIFPPNYPGASGALLLSVRQKFWWQPLKDWCLKPRHLTVRSSATIASLDRSLPYNWGKRATCQFAGFFNKRWCLLGRYFCHLAAWIPGYIFGGKSKENNFKCVLARGIFLNWVCSTLRIFFGKGSRIFFGKLPPSEARLKRS